MPTDKLRVGIRIAARPATVFRYLSDPERFSAWMGDVADAVGEILELIPDRRVVFTYGYRDNPAMGPGSTKVRIELEPDGEGTRVVLTHEGLPDKASARGHEGGWRHYLSRLRGAAVADQLSGGAEAAIDAYMSAWGETDDTRRGELLARCWSDEGLFADSMGSAEGRAGLSTYIAAAQQFMPGARLDRVGSVTLVLDRARFAWRAFSAEGTPLGQGVNFVEFDATGRIARLSGFWDAGGQG